MVALDADVAAVCHAVLRPILELARRDAGIPIRTPELVLDDFLAVEPVLHMRAVDDDARRVPFVGGRYLPARYGIERVVGRRPTIGRLVVRRADVVLELILRPAPVDVIVVLGGAIEDAAVASVADLPFELELEVPELFFRHEIFDAAGLRDRAVNDVPAGRNGVAVEAAPGRHRRAVEQRP